jgi:hypothetical protein
MEKILQEQISKAQQIYQKAQQLPLQFIQNQAKTNVSPNASPNVSSNVAANQTNVASNVAANVAVVDTWIKFNCRGIVVEANPNTVIRSKKIRDMISRKEWTPHSAWRVDVRAEDWHIFLDYLCGSSNEMKNPIVRRLCEEFEVDNEIREQINSEIDKLINEIVSHINRNKDAFALLSVPQDKSKAFHNHSLQFLIPSSLISKYSKRSIDEFDEFIRDNPLLLDEYLSVDRELMTVDGLVLPNKFKLLKRDDNYYVEAECELVSTVITYISQVVMCGNFRTSQKTSNIIEAIKTECPYKLIGYLRNFGVDKCFDVYIPEYYWIQRSKPAEYPTVTVPAYVAFNGKFCHLLDFKPNKNKIRGDEYDQYPRIRVIYDASLNKCDIEIFKLEWKLEQSNPKSKQDRHIKVKIDDDNFSAYTQESKKSYSSNQDKFTELRLFSGSKK